MTTIQRIRRLYKKNKQDICLNCKNYSDSCGCNTQESHKSSSCGYCGKTTKCDCDDSSNNCAPNKISCDDSSGCKNYVCGIDNIKKKKKKKSSTDSCIDSFQACMASTESSSSSDLYQYVHITGHTGPMGPKGPKGDTVFGGPTGPAGPPLTLTELTFTGITSGVPGDAVRLVPGINNTAYVRRLFNVPQFTNDNVGTSATVSTVNSIDTGPGDFYFCGNFNTSLTIGTITVNPIGPPTNSMYVSKTNIRNGLTQWVKVIGTSSSSSSCNDITFSEEAVFLCGAIGNGIASFDGVTSISVGNIQQAFLARLDHNGNWIWAIPGVSSNLESTAQSISVADGNIYCSGSFSAANITFSGGSTVTNTSASAGFIVKVQPNGNIVWTRSINATTYLYITCMETDRFGNSYLGGYFRGTIELDDVQLQSSTNRDSVLIMKFNRSGFLVWAVAPETMNDTFVSPDLITSITVDYDSHMVIIGGNIGTSTKFGNCVLPGGGFISGLSAGGQFIWALSTGKGENVGSAQKFISVNAISVNSYGNVYVTGQFCGLYEFADQTITSSVPTAFVARANSGNWIWVKQTDGAANATAIDNVPEQRMVMAGSILTANPVTADSIVMVGSIYYLILQDNEENVRDLGVLQSSASQGNPARVMFGYSVATGFSNLEPAQEYYTLYQGGYTSDPKQGVKFVGSAISSNSMVWHG